MLDTLLDSVGRALTFSHLKFVIYEMCVVLKSGKIKQVKRNIKKCLNLPELIKKMKLLEQ